MDKSWKIIIHVLDSETCNIISNSIYRDIVYTTFGLSGELDNYLRCPNSLKLFTDSKLREKYLKNPNCVWRHNFSQRPLVSKNCGMVNIYHNREVKDYITFNPNILNHIISEYNEKAIYAKGPERVSMKVEGSTDMNRHMDTNFKNHENRIQAFVTLSIDISTNRDLSSIGSIEVLSNFNNYFDFYKYFIEENSDYNSETYKSDKNPVILDKIFIESIPYFNNWIKEKIYKENKYPEIKKPINFQEMIWEFPSLKIGDLFVWDSKIPHRNTKNKSCIPRIVSYISLYPISTWKKLGNPNIYDMFAGKSKSQIGRAHV